MPETATHKHTRRRKEKPRFEVADIFRRYIEAYCRTHKLSFHEKKVVWRIMACRTEELGYHQEEVCDECGYTEPAYDSCRDRNCPKCQGSKCFQWVEARLGEVLPIVYYHVVFTLPHFLNGLAWYNKALIYDLFYQAAAHTLLVFGQDPKYLGAELGFVAILHTWGQVLSYHVHWHFIVTGGGITEDEQRWKGLPYREEFLFPSKAMSKVICGKFIDLLKAAYRDGRLEFPDALAELADPVCFEHFVDQVAMQTWYNYCKEPFAGPEEVIKYIGRYTHRVAICNDRLLEIDNGKVKFSYKDYRDNDKIKERVLPAEVFIQRFLWHIVPKGFHKIRHGGFLRNPVRKKKLELARQLLGVLADQVHTPTSLQEAWGEDYEEFEGRKCPQCQRGTMILREVSPAKAGRRFPVWMNSS
jgi:hypothetical protein